MANLWLHFSSGANVLPKSAVIKAFNRLGMEVVDFQPEKANGPGVIFFDELTPGLYQRLQEFSRSGLERIFAVAVRQTLVSSETAWRLLRAGASDVLAWNRVKDPATVIAARIERWAAVDRLVGSPLVQNNLVGRSSAWISVLRQVVEAARFTDASILITGETGTGKELVARLVHSLDPRSLKKDLVVLDCTTIVSELSGSEFFGHERGAFTGALAAREGAFALANSGTLFLDEVGDLPLHLQAQLLRVVQEGVYKRVGGNTWQETKFRLVCATNRNFEEELARGRFRQDFYYRIATWTCKLPSLRERPEDIIPLARHFMKQASPDREPPEMDEFVREYLLTRQYPGNVRDLRRLIYRIMHHHVGNGPITIGDIPEDERFSTGQESADWRDPHFENSIRRAVLQGIGLKEIGRAAEDAAIRGALDSEEGNLRRAASRLAVTERALQIRRAARRKNNGHEALTISVASSKETARPPTDREKHGQASPPRNAQNSRECKGEGSV